MKEQESCDWEEFGQRGPVRLNRCCFSRMALPDGRRFALRPHPGQHLADIETADILPPILPGKIVCVGLNYLAHVTENDPSRQAPDEPVIFMKPPSALVGHQGRIRIAHPGHRTDYEAELAVVIGKEARKIEPADALSFV